MGTRTGYAYGDKPDQFRGSGVLDLKPHRFEGGGMRFLRFRRLLEEVVRTSQGDYVVFEEVRHHKGVDAAHLYGGLVAILGEVCEERSLPYKGVSVGTIKKHATGKGNADKKRMMVAAKKRGWNPCDDNEADALWLLDYELYMENAAQGV